MAAIHAYKAGATQQRPVLASKVVPALSMDSLSNLEYQQRITSDYDLVQFGIDCRRTIPEDFQSGSESLGFPG